MAVERNDVLAWSYHPCLLVKVEKGEKLKVVLENLCGKKLKVPMVIVSNSLINKVLTKVCISRRVETLTYWKCMKYVCVKKFPLGEFECVKRNAHGRCVERARKEKCLERACCGLR